MLLLLNPPFPFFLLFYAIIVDANFDRMPLLRTFSLRRFDFRGQASKKIQKKLLAVQLVTRTLLTKASTELITIGTRLKNTAKPTNQDLLVLETPFLKKTRRRMQTKSLRLQRNVRSLPPGTTPWS